MKEPEVEHARHIRGVPRYVFELHWVAVRPLGEAPSSCRCKVRAELPVRINKAHPFISCMSIWALRALTSH